MRRFLLLGFLSAAIVWGEKSDFTATMINGRMWNSMTEAERTVYVSGIHDVLTFNSIMDRSKLPLMQDWAEAFVVGDYIHELSELYKDTANVLIPVPMAFYYATERLKGTHTKDDLERTLITLRTLAREYTKLDEPAPAPPKP